ncbi:hypothetical protein NEMBOFW57_007140 [Staphylotrichum longicolle]|uniref:NACHT domain-containing protein n=1 Tax=Staphylotrichum longicolle TaxID=669026 RepID=A0AAD4HX58_9PEZI|nr:hypothetical protein NEMBOFW57_007140 [Staphylotrichum longicolle]
MGGLVVKQAYLLGRREPGFRTVADRVCSIFFLATPHQGASIAQVLSRLTTVIGTRPFVEDLFPQSPLIQSLSEDFPQICADLELFSFYETRPMSVGINKILIVEKSSAVMNLPNERRTFLEADHRNVAMFAIREDPSYVSVRNALATVVASKRHRRQSLELAKGATTSREDRNSLSRFLDVYGAPEDDLMTQESLKLPGSCEWLINHECYQSWKTSPDPAFLWLQGRPGAGKSVLSSHIVDDLRSQALDCRFFFFQARDTVKSTVTRCLQSMAWQMAMLHPEILDKMRDMITERRDNMTNSSESRSVWQRIFLAGILKVKPRKRQFWVIDAMDECTGSSDMTVFLTRIQEHWPLSVLVTSRDAAENHKRGTSRKITIESHAISEQDSLQDISLLLEADLPYLPCLASDRWPTPEKLASEILESQVTSEREITEVMNSIPSDMDALYCDILARMETARFGKETTKAILAWAAYAFRPLHLAEMQTAIEMDIEDKISDVQRVISRCCGSLLYVDKYDKVQLVHLTAREFLTRGGTESEFVLTTTFLFQHLDHADPNEEELLLVLFNFLQTPSLPNWIEYMAANGDLRTVHNAGNTIKTLLSRRSQHPQPADRSIAPGQQKLEILRKWGDDLTHVVLRFSERLRRFPKIIHHHIAPFCPPDSAIRQAFGCSTRGISVHGLSPHSWNDCLTTIRYEMDRNPELVAAAPGYIAVTIDSEEGQIRIHDDAIFEEMHTIRHVEWVHHIAFAKSGRYFASVGKNAVRVWSPSNGLELVCFQLPRIGASKCVAFAQEDTILRIATDWNQLIEWDMVSNTFIHDEPVSWELDLPKRIRGRQLEAAWLSPGTNLLAALYTDQGHDIVFWDCAEKRFHHVYEQDTEVVQSYGSTLGARGWLTVCAGVLSHGPDNLFAATFSNGHLVVFDLDAGKPVAVNIEEMYSIKLASAHDGRTLVAFDTGEQLTLYEFKTLRLLYRRSLEATDISYGFTFTGDNLRVVEMCLRQWRVWEPPVLRTERSSECKTLLPLPEQSRLEDIIQPTVTKKAQQIIAMTCSHESNLVFCALGDGSVVGYDISGPEPQKELLFVHTVRPNRPKWETQVTVLSFDDRSKILVCGDSWDGFTARTVVRRQQNPQRPGLAWKVGSPLVDVQRRLNYERLLTQILPSSNHERLLVVTKADSTLWAMPLLGEEMSGGWISRIETEWIAGSHRWISRAGTDCGAEVLLRIGETGKDIGVYDWATLSLLRLIPLSISEDVNLVQFACLSHPDYFATDAVNLSGVESPFGGWTHPVLLWDDEDFGGPSSQPISPRWEVIKLILPFRISHLIGIFGRRLVFYTRDYWIVSFEVTPLGSPEGTTVDDGSFARHFFLPNDWNASYHPSDSQIEIGRNGEIIMGYGDELAVIKRALEITIEDGGM